MKALLCTHYGTPDDLVLSDVPNPVAGSGEVVVRIHAAALNFFDTLIIAGKYQVKPPFPFSPAAECAGVVESLGAGVTTLKVGDRVLAYSRYGAARERIALPAAQAPGAPVRGARSRPSKYLQFWPMSASSRIWLWFLQTFSMTCVSLSTEAIQREFRSLGPLDRGSWVLCNVRPLPKQRRQ